MTPLFGVDILILIMESIQNEILNIRVEMGLTLQGFAKVIGVSSSTVHNWETGKTQLGRFYQKVIEKKFPKFFEVIVPKQE